MFFESLHVGLIFLRESRILFYFMGGLEFA